MKKLLSVLMLLSFVATSTVHAQDAKAKSIMDKVSANLKKAKAISANFSLSVIDAHGKKQMTKTGTFQMKGNKYKVALKGGQEIICDGSSVWTYMSQNKEVQVSTYSPESQAISPSTLFSGSYEKEYTYSYAGTKTIAGKSVTVISLKPKKKNTGFSKVDLYINTATNMIAGGHVYGTAGTSYAYSISNVKTTSDISSSVFTFNTKAHPGVDVIDLR